MKKRQSSKTDISDFQLGCTKTFPMKVCYHGSNFRQKFQAVLEYAFRECDKNTTLPRLRSLKTKELRDIRYSISIGNLILGFNSVKVSCLVHYDTLITKCDGYYYKMQQKFITKCVSYYKLRRSYYKMRQLLQNATFATNCDSTRNNVSARQKNETKMQTTYTFLSISYFLW